MATPTPVDRPIAAVCPACGAGLRHSLSGHLLRCRCGWSRHLTPAQSHALVWALAGAGDLAAVVAEIAAAPPAPAPARTLRTGKQVLPHGQDGESEWEQLMRLGAQAALNGVRVTPWDARLLTFDVTSQDPRTTVPHLVQLNEYARCTCRYGAAHPGSPCAHIGAVYFWLLREREASPAAATDLLWGAA